ncbi:MAG: hypothetical protein QM784_33895 [Polyangiaceae bacterium]
MSTLPAESNSAPASIVEPILAYRVFATRVIDLLQRDSYIPTSTGCPLLDEPEKRRAFAEFLRTVTDRLAQCPAIVFDGSIEDYFRALADLERSYSEHASLGQRDDRLRGSLLVLVLVVVQLADTLEDLELEQRALEWQICLTTPGRERAEAHATLAEFFAERIGDPAKAKLDWMTAAREVAADAMDPRGALGYRERAFSVAGDDPNIAEVLVLDYAKLGDWAMVAAPFNVLLRSAVSNVAIERVVEVLRCLEAFAIEQRESQVFATLVDEVLWGVSRDSAPYARPLMASKARVLAADPDRFDAALEAYYALLDAHATDDDQNELTSLIRTRSDTRERHASFVRFFEWRMSRAEDPRTVLRQWAKMEEQEFQDYRASATQLERILAQDPTNTEALREIRRLHERNADWDAVELTLRRLSELATGAERDEADCERAEILAVRLDCPEAACALLSTVLERGAEPTRPRAILESLLTSEDLELRLSVAEQLFSLGPSDKAQLLPLLRTLLDATAALAKDGPGRGSVRASALRRQWFEQAVLLAERTDTGFAWASEAAVEFPDSDALWDVLGSWSNEPTRTKEIVEVYGRAIERTADRELVELLGKKMVTFSEHATVDMTIVVEGLMKLVRAAPGIRWALDRVKLHLGAQGRWSELLGLYDRAIDEARSNADVAAETSLLTEASVTAKDLANDAERALRYFERMLELHPEDARTYAALERLYERHGHTERLVAHLERRAPSLVGAELRQLKERIATLWVDAGRPELALECIREALDAHGEWPSAVVLLERIARFPRPDLPPKTGCRAQNWRHRSWQLSIGMPVVIESSPISCASRRISSSRRIEKSCYSPIWPKLSKTHSSTNRAPCRS